MEISLHRSSSVWRSAWVRALPLWVFFDGQPVGSLKVGETKSIRLPDHAGRLQVGILKADLEWGLLNLHHQACISACHFASAGYPISLTDAGKHFSTGARRWVMFDLIGFCYLSYFARQVFYLRAEPG